MISKLHFSITHGMRGFFAVLVDDEGCPINSGIGSYDNPQEAWIEAAEWAEAEGYPLQAEVCRKRAENIKL